MKSKIILSLFLLVSSGILSANAQPILRHDARHCIHRSGSVMFEAQKAVRLGKVYTGDLARAVAHQRYAKVLFAQGKYLRAIHQSIRARRLAFVAFEANKAMVKAEWRMDRIENRYEKSLPADKELDSEVPDYDKQKDEDIVNADIKNVDMGEAEK